MATSSDALTALELFQRDLDRLPLQRSETDPNLLVHLDQADDHARLAFARVEGRTVTAIAVFYAADPVDGVLLFHGLYAVHEAYRNQGRAKDIVSAALRQIEHGFARAEVSTIQVRVLVADDNLAARKVAEAVISPDPVRVTGSAGPALVFAATLRQTAH